MESASISAAYGFHSAGVVKDDGTGPGLRMFVLWIFRGPKEVFILGSMLAYDAQESRDDYGPCKQGT